MWRSFIPKKKGDHQWDASHHPSYGYSSILSVAHSTAIPAKVENHQLLNERGYTMDDLEELLRFWKDVAFYLRNWLPPSLKNNIQQTVYYLESIRLQKKGG